MVIRFLVPNMSAREFNCNVANQLLAILCVDSYYYRLIFNTKLGNQLQFYWLECKYASLVPRLHPLSTLPGDEAISMHYNIIQLQYW